MQLFVLLFFHFWNESEYGICVYEERWVDFKKMRDVYSVYASHGVGYWRRRYVLSLVAGWWWSLTCCHEYTVYIVSYVHCMNGYGRWKWIENGSNMRMMIMSESSSRSNVFSSGCLHLKPIFSLSFFVNWKKLSYEICRYWIWLGEGFSPFLAVCHMY